MRILDLGSGNTCKNNPDTILRMIKILSEIDPERKFILKWQLFKKAGNNIPLLPGIFSYAYNIATDYGFKITSSVFDKESLNYLLQYDIPFIKIANRPELYWLIGEVPRKIPVLFSFNPKNNFKTKNTFLTNFDKGLLCVSKYPAKLEDYENDFPNIRLGDSISDHTTNWNLFRKYKPVVYECHFKLPDSEGLDAGPFARTPEQIKEVYDEL